MTCHCASCAQHEPVDNLDAAPVTRDEMEQARILLERLLSAVREGGLSASSTHATAIVRRLEGVLITLQVQLDARPDSK